MASKYDVRAKLVLDARSATGQAKRVSKGVKELDKNIKNAKASAGHMVAKLATVGAAYFGLAAVSRIFSTLTRDAIGYNATLEKTKIGLTSVLQAVDGGSWQDAKDRADQAFKSIKKLSITSPATPQEMFGIFQGIIGPIRNAGFGMQKVLDLTSATTLAASALNVDYEQAQRDISMMVRGVAGVDVKTFSLLRSTNAIKETTEEWNALVPVERVNKLAEALDKFKGSGEEFAGSWAGLTSTFKGLRQELQNAFFSPFMNVMKKHLSTLTGNLITNYDSIEAAFNRAGSRMAVHLDSLITRTVNLTSKISQNWDQISKGIAKNVAILKSLAPVLAVVGGGAMFGGGMSGFKALAGKASAQGVANKKRTKGGVGIMASLTAPLAAHMLGSGFGGGKIGGKAMKMMGGKKGGGGGFAGTLGALMMPLTFLMGKGGLGGLTAALSSLAAVAAPLAAVFLVLVGVAAAVQEQWMVLREIFSVTTTGLFDDIMQLVSVMWYSLKPVFKMIGHFIALWFVPAWAVLVPLLRILVRVLALVFAGIGYVTNAIYDKLKPAIDFVYRMFLELSKLMMKVFDWIAVRVDDLMPKQAKEREKLEFQDIGRYDQRNIDGSTSDARKLALGDTPSSRGGTVINNDFKGSRITIKQDFQGKHDPDRIVRAMMDDLTRQAEQRISSGFSGALTR